MADNAGTASGLARGCDGNRDVRLRLVRPVSMAIRVGSRFSPPPQGRPRNNGLYFDAEPPRHIARQCTSLLSIFRETPALLVAPRVFDRRTVERVRSAINSLPKSGLDVVLVASAGATFNGLALADVLRGFGELTVFLPLPVSGSPVSAVLVADRIVLGSLGAVGPIVGIGRPKDERLVRKALRGHHERLVRRLVGGHGRLEERGLRALGLPVRRPRRIERSVADGIADAVIESPEYLDLVEAFDSDGCTASEVSDG